MFWSNQQYYNWVSNYDFIYGYYVNWNATLKFNEYETQRPGQMAR